ncbi:prepilin-type N-terminal cleavage/methylation domain-containing protein [Vibrio mytili]|uniref:PilW family protein n=1 Tax=Vibrio mytili TaxID=50718 RepID=UPI003C6EB955
MKIRGFTLMEMIVTIVIGSFIMLGIAGYARLGMKGYSDSIDRQRLQTQAQFVLEKMSREIRHAVPNSFHEPETGCLEFVPIQYSGFYALAENDIQFLIGNDSSLTDIPNNSRMVINPTRYKDLLSSSSQSIEVGGLNKNGDAFTISGTASSLGATSVSSRHYIYREGSEISYCFKNDQVLRNNVIVSENVLTAESNMHYVEPTLQRGGIVYLDLVFEQDGERSAYQQDVQVLNVP